MCNWSLLPSTDVMTLFLAVVMTQTVVCSCLPTSCQMPNTHILLLSIRMSGMIMNIEFGSEYI